MSRASGWLHTADPSIRAGPFGGRGRDFTAETRRRWVHADLSDCCRNLAACKRALWLRQPDDSATSAFSGVLFLLSNLCV